jgi:hypothetical protein
MIRSIKLTYYRDNPSGNWPFSVNWDLVDSNIDDLQEAGIQLYYTSDLTALWEDPDWAATKPHTYDSINVMDHHYVFPTDEIYASASGIAYANVPIWKNLFSSEELTAYHTANFLRVVYEEIENPDLSSYIVRPY